MSVSYTHLDVYKRQLLNTWFLNDLQMVEIPEGLVKNEVLSSVEISSDKFGVKMAANKTNKTGKTRFFFTLFLILSYSKFSSW